MVDGRERQGVYFQVEELKSYRLDVPQVTELAYELQEERRGFTGWDSDAGGADEISASHICRALSGQGDSGRWRMQWQLR